MKKFTRDYRIPEYHSAEFDRYFGKFKPCVFDIETTGLSRNNSKVILTALLSPIEDGVRVTQFLAENHYEEHRIIAATLDYLREEGIGYIVSYNGRSFDIPFFNTRAEALRSEACIRMYDFDLYKFLKKHSTLPTQLDSLSQKSVERCYGILGSRRDTISGGESVRLYNEYAVNGNSINEKLIITHNREDVAQLQKLMLRAGADDFCSILKDDTLDEALSEFGFPISSGSNTKADLAVRCSLDCRKALLRINGDQLGEAIALELFPDEASPYRASFSAVTKCFNIELPLKRFNDDFYVELKALELDNELRELKSYVNGFLILSDEARVNYRTVNRLAAALAVKIYNSNK